MDKEVKTDKTAGAQGTPATGGTVSQETVAKLAEEAGVSKVKLAGIMAYAGWNEDTKVSKSTFKKISDEWLGHPLGTGKKRKEVS